MGKKQTSTLKFIFPRCPGIKMKAPSDNIERIINTLYLPLSQKHSEREKAKKLNLLIPKQSSIFATIYSKRKFIITSLGAAAYYASHRDKEYEKYITVANALLEYTGERICPSMKNETISSRISELYEESLYNTTFTIGNKIKE